MKKSIRTFILWLLLASLCTISCTKWDFDRIEFIQVITVGALGVTATEAFLIGDIENLRNVTVTESGFVLSNSESMESSLQLNKANTVSIQAANKEPITGDRAFATNVKGLIGHTTYWFRAYVLADGESSPAYGQIESFSTEGITVELLSLERINTVCPARVDAVIQTSGVSIQTGVPIQSHDVKVGLVWSDQSSNRNPTLENGQLIAWDIGVNAEGRAVIPTSMPCDQTYFIRAYANPVWGEAQYSETHIISTTVGGSWIPTSTFPGTIDRKDDFPQHILFGVAVADRFIDELDLGFVIAEDGNSKVLWEFNPELTQWMNRGISPISTMKGAVVNIPPAPGLRFWIYESGDSRGSRQHIYKAGEDIWEGGIPRLEESISQRQYPFFFSDLIGTGRIGGVESKDVWQRNPSVGSYDERKNDFPDTRQLSVVFIIDEIAYVGLGKRGDEILSDFDFYDVETDTWTQITPFPEQVLTRIAFSMNGKGYVMGGVDENENPHSGFWEYDPVTDAWTRLTNLAGGQSNANVAFVLEGCIYAGLGEMMDGTPSNELWEYVPELK